VAVREVVVEKYWGVVERKWVVVRMVWEQGEKQEEKM
jgi:hypothetical protein